MQIPISKKPPCSSPRARGVRVRHRASVALLVAMAAACAREPGEAPRGERVASQSAAVSTTWTCSGPGQNSVSADSDVDTKFDYDDRNAVPSNWDRWTLSATASATERVAYSWDYTGLHSWYQAHAKLTAFADGPNGRVLVPLVDRGVWDYFGEHGSVELDTTAGAAFGFLVEGKNLDSARLLQGTLRLRRLTPPAGTEPDPKAWSTSNAASPPFALTAGQTAGRIEGESAVSASGAAVYSIPIQIPPGTRGAAPTLSIGYDSQTRNGALGMGFRLHGISSIARCAPNVVDDGKRGTVRLTADDRFCLNGAALVAIQGSYGADGTVYRLHRDDFTTIVSNGVCGEGPCSFRATARDGSVSEFGTSGTSAVPVAGGTVDAAHAALAWSVAREMDTDGNEVQFEYTYVGADGEHLPSTIRYSANARTGAIARRAVAFEYENRDDAIVAYVGGAKTGLARRMTRVRTSVDGVTVTEYQLAYQARQKGDPSRLQSVKECDASGACLPATSFGWSDGAGFDAAPAFDTKGPSLRSDPGSYAVTPAGVYADFDGDGVLDYADAACSTYDCRPAIWRGGPSGFKDAGFTLPGPVNVVAGAVSKVGGVVVDINGDGRADYARGICFDTGTCRLDVFRSNGHGFDVDVALPLPLFQVESNGARAQQVGSLVDVDGDGVLDVVTGVCRSSGGACDRRIFLRRKDKYELAPFLLQGPLVRIESNGWRVQETGVLVDLDGDRIADYVAGTCDENSKCDKEVFRGTGRGFEKAGFSLPGPVIQREANGFRARQVGVLKDFNGDGISDYVSAACPDNGAPCDRFISFGTGRGFEKTAIELPGALFRTEATGWRAKQEGSLEDFNGDGFLDYVAGTCVDGPQSKCTLGIRLGSRGGFLPASASIPAGLFQTASQAWDIKRVGVLIDMNGDGALDYSAATCGIVGAACDKSVRLGRSGGADRLVSVTDGLNLRTSFAYAPLTQPGVYTAKAPPVATGVEARWPLYVVSGYTVVDQKGLKKDFSYSYEQSWTDPDRRAWMGFGRVTRTDLVSKHTLATSYLQEDPSVGVPTSATENDAAGNPVHASTWTFERVADPVSPSVVRHRMKEERSRVFASGGVVETWRASTYDAKDNVTVLREGTTGGATKKTCRTYESPTGMTRLADLVEEKVGSDAMACGQGWTASTDLAWRKLRYTASGHVAVEASWLDTTSAWVEAKTFYDAYGNAVALVDANGGATTVDVDDFHTFPRRKRGPWVGSGGVVDEEVVYDPRFGTRLTRTLPGGVTFRTEHDTFGRALVEYGPLQDGTGEVALATYARGIDAGGAFVTQTVRIAWNGARGAALLSGRASVDAWGQVARTERANGALVTETARDARGRLAGTSAPHFANDAVAWSTVSYDEADRVTTRTDPDGVVHSSVYTVANGLVTTTTEPSGTASVTRSGRGAEITRTLPNGGVVQATTDALDRVTRTVDPTGGVRTMTYDSLGRVTAETTPDTGTTTFAYDDVGHLVSTTGADGKSIRTRYDARGRVAEERIDGPAAQKIVTREYDAGTFGWGLLSKMTTTQASGAMASEAFEYDAYGHATKRTMTIAGRAFVSSFETGPTGVVDKVTHPNGAVVTTFHNDRGLPERIEVAEGAAPAATYATFGGYDASDRARDVAYLNGVSSRFEYDDGATAVGLPLGVTARVNGSAILQQTYKWSSSRWLERVDDALIPTSSRLYHYDGMGYLKDASTSQTTQTYDYDKAGAILSKEGVTYTYVPGTHRVATTSDGGAFEYTANGNRTRGSRGGVDTTYEYDAAGALLAVRRGTETRERLEYDGGGNRYSKSDADGATTLYVSPSDEITISPSGAELYTVYIHGPHGRVAAISRPSPAGASLSGGGGFVARKGDELRKMFDASTAAASRTVLRASTFAVGLFVVAAWGTLVWGAGTFASAGARRHRLRAAFAPALSGVLLLTTSPSHAALIAAANGAGRPEAGVVFFHEDPTASTLLVTGSSGEIVARTSYTPFGEIDLAASSGRDAFRPKFSGKEWEEDVGAYYFGARYYDPKLGSFLTPDSARQYFGAYTYAGNNPRSAVDPDGNFAFLVPFVGALIAEAIQTLVVGAAVGAAVGMAAGAITYAATPETQRPSGGIGRAIGMGAAIGFTAGLTGSAVGAGVGAAAGAMATGLGASTIAAGAFGGFVGAAAGGAVDGLIFQVMTNHEYGRPLGENAGASFGIGLGIGAAFGAARAGWGAARRALSARPKIIFMNDEAGDALRRAGADPLFADFQDVAAHGNPSAMARSSDPRPPEHFATLTSLHPRYATGPVRLCSCNTALSPGPDGVNGLMPPAAKRYANWLHSDVLAPHATISGPPAAGGPIAVETSGRQWSMFSPQFATHPLVPAISQGWAPLGTR